MSERIDIGDLEVGAAPDIASEAPASPVEPRKTLTSGLDAVEAIRALEKALEAGGYNVMPSALVQGCSLKVEDLDATMKVVTFDDKHIKMAPKPPPGAIFSGARAKLSLNGVAIQGFEADFTYSLENFPAFERAVDDVADAFYRFSTMAVAAPRKNVIIADLQDPGADDAVVVTGGTVLTEKLLREAIDHAQAQADQMVLDQIVLAPAQYEAYQTLMSQVLPNGMVVPAGYRVPVCGKCNKSTPTCTCYARGDDEETPDLAEAKRKAEKLAADIDFKMVSREERVKAASSKLLDGGLEGTCYVCAHPKRPAFAHKQTRMRFCLPCAEQLLV